MGCQVVNGRKLKLPEGHKLLRSIKVEGLAYFPKGGKLMLDYVSGGDTTYVIARQKTPGGRAWGRPRTWDLEAVKERKAPDLAVFAKRLDIREPPDVFLAKLIEVKHNEIRQA